MTPQDIELEVSPSNGKSQRLVVAFFCGATYREQFDINSAVSRQRFFNRLGARAALPVAELAAALEPRLMTLADEADALADADAEIALADGAARKNQATQLVELAGGMELWNTAIGDAYGTIFVGGHWENWRLRNRACRQWLAKRYYEVEHKSPGGQALQDALTVLEGQAMYDGATQAVFTRMAAHEGRFYLDLCDHDWRVVEISAAGWDVLDRSPIRFRRAKAMLPLPTPVRGGQVDELRQFINVTDHEWPLIIGWLIGTLCPSGPFPLLSLHGEQGSGKSTQARMLRGLIDPNAVPVRAEPRDLMIAATNGWIVALDNLSGVPQWLSDALCRLSTGGGFSTRLLYSDDEEQIFDAMRPVLLTGIDDLDNRADLLDRSVLVHLPRLEDRRRRTEADLLKQFHDARPRLLGALLDVVVAAMANLPHTSPQGHPRMADFARWVLAAEPALPWPPGAFLRAYQRNRAQAHELALEASLLTNPLFDLVSAGTWQGSVTELHRELDRRADDRTKKSRGWPTGPTSLGGQLRRLAPNLRAAGVEVEFGADGRGRRKRRVVTIFGKTGESAVPTDPSVPTSENIAGCGDGGDGGDARGDVAGSAPGGDVNPSGTTDGDSGVSGDTNFSPPF